jgi:hypothetical protein
VTTDDPERLFGQRPHRRLAPTESDGPTGHHNDVDEEHDEHHPTSSTAIIAGMGGETTTGEKERRRPTAFARDLNQPAQNPQETDAEERVNQQPKVIIPSSLSSAAVARW